MKNIFFVLFFLILLSCNNEPLKVYEAPVDSRDSSTIKMAEELVKWNEYLTPEKSNYKSKERSVLFHQKAQTSSGLEKLTFEMRSYYELLNAGESELAYQGFNRIENQAKSMGIHSDQPVYNMVRDFRAIAQLRIGEQQNCLNNHSARSCILPFDERSYHQLQDGSKEAIKELEILLNQNDNLNNRWILNIAYMTLGKYPEEVPKKWLIPILKKEKPVLKMEEFQNIASKIGIDDNRLSGGVIVEDFDNDNDLDIMVSSWNLTDQLFYYENDGQGNFTNKYKEALIEGITGGLNINHGDYNNDGFMDVFITRGAWLPLGTFPNSLLRNNRDGTFTDVTRESGIYSLFPSQTSVWADFNNDGWLDIFIGNESSREFQNECELYLNDGNGHFKNIANEVGGNISAFVKGVSSSDFDNDGDIDLYLSNMAGDNLLLENLQDDSMYGFHFQNIASQAGVTKPSQSFPCWFFDINNDGWDDIFISSFPHNAYGNFGGELAKEMLGQTNNVEKPKIYINNKKGAFIDKTIQYKLNTTCYSMGSGFGDLNNDGYMDFYLGTGEPDFKALVPNRMFLNVEGKTFEEVTTQGGFGHLQKGHGISFADLNQDGQEDVYAVMGGAYEGDVFYNALFLNPGSDNNWIKIKLEGTESNKIGYGSKIEVITEQNGKRRSIFKTISSGASFGNNPSLQNIGFPKSEILKEVVIHWPSGNTQKINGLKEKKYYKITEGNDIPEKIDLKPIIYNLDEQSHHHAH